MTQVLNAVPPHNKEFEEAVLGAILLEKNAYYQIADFFNEPEFFYYEKNQLIFKTIMQLMTASKPVDILTVIESLTKQKLLNDAGGPVYISMLTNNVSDTANIEYHARIIMQNYSLRYMIKTANNILLKAYDASSDVFDLHDEVSSEFLNLSKKLEKKQALQLSEILYQNLKHYEEIEKRRNLNQFVGVISGFLALDKVTGGWQAPQLIILAARPGMGKTALALNFALNATKDTTQTNKVAIFSLEMTSNQLVNRLISTETDIPLKKILLGDLSEAEKSQILNCVSKLENKKLFIDDTPSLSVLDLRNKARALQLQHKGLNLIIVDYLQLMTTGINDKNKTTVDQITFISKNLKSIAKELGVPIIALSQLSRAVEQRGGTKRPMLSDLRESGAIEQDADIVIFPYRPEYYGFTNDEDGNDLTGVAELIIAKNRDGALTNINLRFLGECTKFTNYNPF